MDDEKICYLDVCLLYPYVNKYGKYPVGHPKIIVGRAECKKVDIRKVEGIIKCSVLLLPAICIIRYSMQYLGNV